MNQVRKKVAGQGLMPLHQYEVTCLACTHAAAHRDRESFANKVDQVYARVAVPTGAFADLFHRMRASVNAARVVRRLRSGLRTRCGRTPTHLASSVGGSPFRRLREFPAH